MDAVKPIAEDTVAYSTDRLQVQPHFPGGSRSWLEFVSRYIYPEAARKNKVTGTIYLNFIVEKDGRLTNIQVENDRMGFGTGEEAIRLMKTSPKWSPGILNGLPVRVKYTQPIKLALN
jgi:protein TonB